MDIELIQIRDFLAAHPPFDALPSDRLDRLPRSLTIRYLRRDQPFPPEEERERMLYILRRGAVEIRDRDGLLLDKLEEGDLYAQPCEAPDLPLPARAVEDTLLYQLPCAQFAELRERNAEFAARLAAGGERLRHAVTGRRESQTPLMTISVGELVRREPLSMAPQATIREVAQQMSREQVSSMLIVEAGQLRGVVTDRDLRNRCLAAGVDPAAPIAEIMTTGVERIDAHALGFEALVTMGRRNIHHLPVFAGSQLRGVVTLTDLMRQQSANAVYTVAEIAKADSVEALAELSRQIPSIQVQLVEAGASAQIVGQTISSVADAITSRLIQLAEAQLGAAPIPYAWLAGGSLARREQTSHSDQDNALLLSPEFRPEHEPYFAALAEQVCDGLDRCGYIYCPGEVMAKNPKWRQPLPVWQGYFKTWIHQPDPEALMLSSVFFDLRTIHGDGELLATLQEQVLRESRSNRIFLAYMAANALKHQPPLGFFRSFVVIHGGEHNNTLDLKHRGVVPVVDLARVSALAAGVNAVNSWERLAAAAEQGELSSSGRDDLAYALEFIASERLRHQVRQIKAGQEADNFVPPNELSKLERTHLKDAFAVIATLQEAIGQRYQAGRF